MHHFAGYTMLEKKLFLQWKLWFHLHSLCCNILRKILISVSKSRRLLSLNHMMIYITSHVIPQYSWFGKMVLNKNFVQGSINSLITALWLPFHFAINFCKFLDFPKLNSIVHKNWCSTNKEETQRIRQIKYKCNFKVTNNA